MAMKPEIRSRGTGPLPGSERGTGGLRSPAAPSGETALADRTSDSPALLSRKLSPGEFNTAMVHLYRGEVQRSNTWRNRLDTTTNWAVITAGATLSFAFSSAENPHFVIPLNSLLVAFFLFMEARRYRYYEIWASRVRMIETGYFAQMLAPGSAPDTKWAKNLYDDLLTPHFTISQREAVGRRLRRNYLWIFLLLAASWVLKVYLHPQPARDFDDFMARAAVGLVPGRVIFLCGIIFNICVLVFALATVRLREATGEVLPRHEFSFHPLRRMSDWSRAASRPRLTLRRTKRARARTRGGRTGSLTGEWKKPGTSELKKPETVTEETLT